MPGAQEVKGFQTAQPGHCCRQRVNPTARTCRRSATPSASTTAPCYAATVQEQLIPDCRLLGCMQRACQALGPSRQVPEAVDSPFKRK